MLGVVLALEALKTWVAGTSPAHKRASWRARVLFTERSRHYFLHRVRVQARRSHGRWHGDGRHQHSLHIHLPAIQPASVSPRQGGTLPHLRGPSRADRVLPAISGCGSNFSTSSAFSRRRGTWVSSVHIPDTKTRLFITFAWAISAHLIVPRLWTLYYRHHPFFAELDRCAQTGDGHPGDPINIALVGDQPTFVRAIHAARRFRASNRSPAVLAGAPCALLALGRGGSGPANLVRRRDFRPERRVEPHHGTSGQTSMPSATGWRAS